MSKVIIVGGGASGLAAAIAASEKGNNVTVIEKNAKVGRKIYITGKGRCNITNAVEPNKFIEKVITNGKFLYSAVNAFTPEDCIDFFNSNGCPLKIERGNRVFPVSDKSSDIIDCLLNVCLKQKVKFLFNKKVTEIVCENGRIKGVVADKKFYDCDKIIIATGGKSYPATGSDGDGYKFLKTLGHTVKPLYPSLVGFDTVDDWSVVHGLTLKNVTLTVKRKNGKVIFNEFGDMTFTDRGVAGPLFITLSAYVNKLDISDLNFYIDLKPALSEEKLKARFLREIERLSDKTLKECLYTLLPKVFIPFYLKNAQISKKRQLNELSQTDIDKLVYVMKNFKISIKSLRPLDEAIVTCGGADVKEVDSRSMASKIAEGLYIVGELLDVDALTGGFNLHIALATGFAAGRSI